MVMDYIVMAYMVMAYIAMAYIVMDMCPRHVYGPSAALRHWTLKPYTMAECDMYCDGSVATA